MSNNFKFTKSAIEWRRSTVLQFLSQGFTQKQIADELHLHPSTISLDCQYLKERAQANLKHHIQEVIPFEYMRAMEGLRRILFETNRILAKESLDDKTKLSTLQLLATVHKDMISLTADGSIVQQAIEKVKQLENTKGGALSQKYASGSISSKTDNESDESAESGDIDDNIVPEEDEEEEETDTNE